MIVTQFQGAFSDNTLKSLVIFLIMGMAMPENERQALVPVVNALFALPFILFSMVGGYLADRYSKRTVTIGVKCFEILVMFCALASLAAGLLWLQLASVFLMGVHSAIFGPSKYGLLPELLPEKRLSWGNGVLELGTFMAIITGTIAGAFLTEYFHGRQFWSGLLLICLAFAGLLTSQAIPRVPPAAPQKKFQLNFVADLVRQVRLIRQDRALWLALLGNSYFFFLAAILQVNIVLYGKTILHLRDTENGYLQAALAIGIGLGSLAAGFLSGGKIEYGLIPLGALGLTTLCAWLAKPGFTFASFAPSLALLGFFSGFFIVPIAALLQHRPARETKGGILAAANLLSFVGVFCASGVYYLLNSWAGAGPPVIFLLGAAATLAVSVYLVFLLPDSLARLVLWLVTHSIYRVRVEGRDAIPEKGGALFVSNHLSMVDALLLIASTDRHIRFIMDRDLYEQPWIKPFARLLKVIPIPSRRPREIIASLRDASQAIRDGGVVCIFPEGQISRTGQLLPFRRGFQKIMRGLEAPIIPVCLAQVWGSIFSFEGGRFFWKWPRRIPYPVTVAYGTPMPASATPEEVRRRIQELQSLASAARKQGTRITPD